MAFFLWWVYDLGRGKMADEQTINFIEGIFEKWIFTAINDLFNSRGVSLGFLIMACAIDYLTGLFKGTNLDTTRDDYINFLKTYKWFSKKYNPEYVYKSLRCGLVHNFTVKKSKFALTHKHPELHLKVTQRDEIILNYEDFFTDIKRLSREFFGKARKDPTTRAKLIERFSQIGILGPVPNLST